MIFRSLIMAAALMTISCDEPDGCEHLDTRCVGDKAELCNADGDWELSMDCGNDEDFECCFSTAYGEPEHYCFLEEECD